MTHWLSLGDRVKETVRRRGRESVDDGCWRRCRRVSSEASRRTGDGWTRRARDACWKALPDEGFARRGGL